MRPAQPSMLNRKTIDLPLAAYELPTAAPAATTSDAEPDVTVDMPRATSALSAVPPKEVISVLIEPVAGTKKLLEKLVPSRYSVPEPKLATYTFGVAGAAAAAVPPLDVVWKSQAAITPASAMPHERPRAPTARRNVLNFMVGIRPAQPCAAMGSGNTNSARGRSSPPTIRPPIGRSSSNALGINDFGRRNQQDDAKTAE